MIKATFFSALITAIRIISGLVGSKVIAMFTGPAGLALIGAFTNFSSILLTLASGSINTGVVKYTAEYKEEPAKLKNLLSTAVRISILCSALTGIVLFIFAGYFSEMIFTTDHYALALRILGLIIVLHTFNSFLISVFSGLGQIKTFTIVNTAGSMILLGLTILLVYKFHIEGAIYALIIAQAIAFFVTLIYLTRSPWFSWSYITQPFNKAVALKLGHFSLMAIVTALTVPVSQIILRNMLINQIGIDAAGYWQGLIRVSEGYLLLITTAFLTYYLPKLSSLKTKKELQKEVFKVYALLMPMVLIGCTIIYFLRFFIITVLYTDHFMPMEQLFIWQLIGDFFKIATWILTYLMLAKAMTRTYILAEIISTVSFIVLSYICLKTFGLRGITIAAAINSFMYFLAVVFLFRKLMFQKHSPMIS